MNEGENLGHVRRDVSYWPDPDLVDVNRFAEVAVSQAVSHDILERLCCLRGMLYRGGHRDDYALPFWENAGKRRFQNAGEAPDHFIESKLA